MKAIKDTLYTPPIPLPQSAIDSSENDDQEELQAAADIFDTGSDLDEFDDDEPFLSISDDKQVLQPDYIRLVSKIRAICSFFSRSGVSQDQLEIICLEKKITVVKINTDVCTRWSSLHQMVSSFLKMYPAIKDCYEKLEKPLDLSPADMKNLNVIIRHKLNKMIK